MTNHSTTPAPALMNEREAAAYLNLSHRTLQAWRVRGGGPQFIKLGSNVRYRPADLGAWLAENTRANTAT
ncbi:helix-turn-helix domain-containing protein [uncultured Thiohalocapsa sp.]|uniref:helix-turn-helix transcriptional regulator n=1 Tax=uncultured Thiohalocapsa sp. TaxID=768990 RepID=UPI0025FFB726|nr:helix-turn-helix domain-containing protein [uncultured Thiohalocapsa sp.]